MLKGLADGIRVISLKFYSLDRPQMSMIYLLVVEIARGHKNGL
jgi:hypothetical protein